MEDGGCRMQDTRIHIEEKKVEVHGDVVHADQGCHGIVLWPWDVDFSMP